MGRASQKIFGLVGFVALVQKCSGLVPEALSRLLLQRAVQTQVMYMTDFHDEVKSRWLSDFGAPCASLDAERLSNQETIPKYHGLEAFVSQSAEGYLNSMLRAPTVFYSVVYAVGRPDMMQLPEGDSKEQEAAAASDSDSTVTAAMGMWTDGRAAAASRRSNPFLQAAPKKSIEYDEEILPARIAQRVMTVRSQLAREWERDLMAIAEGTIEKHFDDREESIASAYARAVRPWTGEDGMEEVSSPLRAASLELCERLCTREAAFDVCEQLPEPSRRWLENMLLVGAEDDTELTPAAAAAAESDDEDERLAALLGAAACRVVEGDALGRHDRRRGLARRWLNEVADSASEDFDPSKLAATIVRRRADLAKDWAEAIVEYIDEEETRLLRSSLESQLD